MYGGMDVQLHVFLILEVMEVSGYFHALAVKSSLAGNQTMLVQLSNLQPTHHVD
jgi:hypothetical protein